MSAISSVVTSLPTPALLLSASAAGVNTAAASAAVIVPASPSAGMAQVGSNSSDSAFLTQVISQHAAEEDERIALSSSFSRFANAPLYTALIGYSIVKFRPSNAGLPSAYSVATAANEYQAYSTTQSRNQRNLAGQSPQLAVAT